jgi:hypothetical protein
MARAGTSRWLFVLASEATVGFRRAVSQLDEDLLDGSEREMLSRDPAILGDVVRVPQGDLAAATIRVAVPLPALQTLVFVRAPELSAPPLAL